MGDNTEQGLVSTGYRNTCPTVWYIHWLWRRLRGNAVGQQCNWNVSCLYWTWSYDNLNTGVVNYLIIFWLITYGSVTLPSYFLHCIWERPKLYNLLTVFTAPKRFVQLPRYNFRCDFFLKFLFHHKIKQQTLRSQNTTIYVYIRRW